MHSTVAGGGCWLPSPCVTLPQPALPPAAYTPRQVAFQPVVMGSSLAHGARSQECSVCWDDPSSESCSPCRPRVCFVIKSSKQGKECEDKPWFLKKEQLKRKTESVVQSEPRGRWRGRQDDWSDTGTPASCPVTLAALPWVPAPGMGLPSHASPWPVLQAAFRPARRPRIGS